MIVSRGAFGKLTKFACKHGFIQYLHFPTENTWRISEDFRTFDNCLPSPDVEYEEPGGLQEKLERLNAIMSTEWAASSANYGRRMQYLSNCEYITYLFRLVSLWFFWNSSFGWLCILGILEWFFLNKHYHGHNFRPLPPQSLPPSLISQPICKVALACCPKNTRHSGPTTCKTAFSHELQPHDSTGNGSSPLQQLLKWLRRFKDINVNIQTFIIFHTF